jgi:5-methylcytosine-specific restriction enzyme A
VNQAGARFLAQERGAFGYREMPNLPPRPCTVTGCRNDSVAGACSSCRAKFKKLAEDRRESSARRGYDSTWRLARERYLSAHPLCVDPFGEHAPVAVAASIVDHITPHKGDHDLFWDERNWQSLCGACHSRKTVMEDGGFGRAVLQREN